MSNITQDEIDSMTPGEFKEYLESEKIDVEVNADFKNPYPEDYNNLLSGKVKLFSSRNFKQALAFVRKVVEE